MRHLSLDMRILLLLPVFALAACGTTGPLKPTDGSSLPPRPVLADATPDAEDLLTPPPFARPERIDELVQRSEPRQPDPFDLPPPEGGSAPSPDPIDDPDAEEVDSLDVTDATEPE